MKYSEFRVRANNRLKLVQKEVTGNDYDDLNFMVGCLIYDLWKILYRADMARVLKADYESAPLKLETESETTND